MKTMKIIFVLAVLLILGFAAYEVYLRPANLGRSLYKQKRQSVKEMQFIIQRIKDYYRDHGDYPENLLKVLDQSADQKNNAIMLSALELQVVYIYIRPNTTNANDDQTVLLEIPGRYSYRRGAHAGEISGAVQWYGEHNMLTYLSNHAISTSIWRAP